MSSIFRIAVVGFFCIVACRSHCQQHIESVKQTCKEREKKYGPDEDCVERICYELLARDAANVTIHIEDYVARLEEILETQDLPSDALIYWYYTAEKPREPTRITATKDSISSISYDTSKTLVLGIHGWTDDAHLDDWIMGEFVQAVVKHYKTNVIFPDFAKFNRDFLAAATPNIYLAAKHMAKFLQFFMNETGFKPEQVYVIGLSLGGQMAGIVARFLPGIGRISGLDPAGTFFHNFPESLRLDRGDANFVDVMHVADETPLLKGWGFAPQCGHLDFYINGGVYQPGCDSHVPIYETPKTLAEMKARICMHQMIAAFWLESFLPNCTFIGTMCESYGKFEKGQCKGNMQAVAGQYATKPVPDLPLNTNFYLDTNDSPPYCREDPVENRSMGKASVSRYFIFACFIFRIWQFLFCTV